MYILTREDGTAEFLGNSIQEVVDAIYHFGIDVGIDADIAYKYIKELAQNNDLITLNRIMKTANISKMRQNICLIC